MNIRQWLFPRKPKPTPPAFEPQDIETDTLYAVGHLIEGMAFYRCEHKGQPVYTGRLNNALMFFTYEEAEQWALGRHSPRSTFGSDLVVFRIETRSVPLKRIRPQLEGASHEQISQS